ncbi:MAG: hypothetical protein SFX18_19620 [Pirellulales bacterium]|nr:hypothetical protein [Pirellulales bacterium]
MAAVTKQKANVYTVMLVISFLCLTLGSVFLYFEMQTYAPNPTDTPWKVPGELKSPN